MTTFRSRKTNTAGKAALFAALTSVIASGSFAQAVNSTEAAAEDDKNVQKLEKYEVTGSRIRRIDAESVSPVTEIKVEQMQAAGYTNLGDVLRTLPMNSGQTLTPTDSGTSFTPGISTINLRGLGNNKTLVLINGRRAVPYAAPGFDGFQTMFDLNSIPPGAIDKIEILKDGGSAIYGSDAVGGVVNIKLLRDYQGLAVGAEIGNYFNTDGFYKKATATLGSSSNKTSITVNMSWEEQNAVFARDIPWAKSADKSVTGLGANPRYDVSNWEGPGFDSKEEYLEALRGYGVIDTNPVSDGYIGDNRSSRGYPGYVRYDVNNDGEIKNGSERFTYASPTSNPTLAGAVNGANFYNFQELNGFNPSYRRYSFYSQMRHDFSSSLYGFAEVSFTRNEYQIYSAATPADIETSNGLDSESPMYIPSYNAYNPFGVDLYDGRRRMIENGPRIADLVSDTPRFLVGLGGDLPTGGIFEDWTWETGVMYSKNSVNNINRGTIADYRLQQALMGLTRLGSGALAWDPSTPQNQRVYFNWFGLNDQSMADFLEVENPDSSSLEYTQFDFKTGGSLFDLPAGQVGLAFGGEYRREKMSVVVSDLNATGNVLGGSEGTSSFGNRSVTAFYAEMEVPLLKNLPGVDILEAQFAGRYEDYSDKGFARQVRPKVGLKYKPTKTVSIRGSYSRSFKAPDLAYLYTAAKTTFSSDKVYDPVTQTQIDQIQTVVAGNPNLQPETSDIYFVGIAWEPTGKLDGLHISLDGFSYKHKNMLDQLSNTYGYAEFLTEAYNGNPLFADKVVRDPLTQNVLYIRDDYVNISTGTYKGVDLDVSYLLKTQNLGHFRFGAMATVLDELKIAGDEQVGGYLTAQTNATASFGWQKGDWGFNTYAVYYGKRQRSVSFGSIFEEGDELYATYTLDPRVFVNAGVTYKGFTNTTIAFRVNNVFNKAPAIDPLDQNGGTSGATWMSPAFWSLSVEHKF